MSSVFININAALNKNLDDMTGKPSIAWEGKKFTPVNSELYLLPTNEQGETIAVTGQDETIGVYQIGILAPVGKGNYDILVIADQIADQFKQDKEITYLTQTVNVRSVSRSSIRPQADGWLHMSVDVTYYAFSDRR